jgi:hypothetical protein
VTLAVLACPAGVGVAPALLGGLVKIGLQPLDEANVVLDVQRRRADPRTEVGTAEIDHRRSYVIRAGMTVEDLPGTWAPYLTMSEALRLAARSFGRDVTKLSCCTA